MSYKVVSCVETGKLHWFEHFSDCPLSGLKKILLDNFGKKTSFHNFGKIIIIPKKDFQSGLDKIKTMTSEDFNKRYPKLTKKGYFKQNIVASLSCIQSQAAKDSDFITLNKI